jgi:hypothetical protein
MKDVRISDLRFVIRTCSLQRRRCSVAVVDPHITLFNCGHDSDLYEDKCRRTRI